MEQPVVRSFLGAALIGMCAFVSFGETYYWQGGDWGQYSDPANWLVGGPDGTAATACPGAEDELYNKQTFRFDLGGGAYEFGKWRTVDVPANWYSLHVRNGSLTAKSDVVTHVGIMDVMEGGTLTLEGSFDPSHWDGSAFETYVQSGGTLNILGHYYPFFAKTSVAKGGVLVLNPTKFEPWNRNVSFDIAGELSLPNGLTCAPTSNFDTSKAITIGIKDGGRLVVGGKVSKTGDRGTLRVSLGGGTVVATDDVTFDTVEGSVAENAALAVEVAEGKTLDLSSFSILSGATLTKSGAGTVRLGAAKFAKLSVESGTLAVGSVFPADEAALADGVTVSLVAGNSTIAFPELSANNLTLKVAASGVTINTLPSAFTDVAFDLSDLVLNVPILTCADESSLETLRTKLAAVLPATQEVYVSGQSLIVTEKKDQVFTGGESGTITDWNDPAGWNNGQVPTAGEVAVQGEGVVLEITASPTVDKIEIARGATVRVAGTAVALPAISLAGSSGLEITSGSANLLKGFTSVASIVGESVTLPTLTVASGATLNLAGGMTFKNVSIDLKGTIAKVDEKGVVSQSGIGPIFGYADAGETSYIAFTSEDGRFEVHSDRDCANGQINFVNPAAGGRVKVVGDIVLKKVTIPVHGWADYGNRFFGKNNPTDEPFTVVLDGTTISASYPFEAAGAALIRLQNGAVVEKNSACANHGFNNVIRDSARVIVSGEGSRFDYGGGCNGSNIDSPAGVDALTVEDGGAYLVGYAGGQSKGVFVSVNGFVGVARQYDNRVRSPLLTGFGSGRIEADSTLTVAPTDKGNGNKDWERRTQFANIPLTGAGDLIIANTAPTKAFTVTVVNGANTCTGVARVEPPVVAEDQTAAETALIFANGANWAGTVVANGYLSLTNPDDETAAAAVTFGKVKLTTALPLRVRRTDAGIVSDTVTLTDGFVVEEGDAGVVELVPQDDFVLGAKEEIPLGTFPKGAFSKVTVKLGKRTLKVIETPTDVEGVVTCSAKPASGFQVIIR